MADETTLRGVIVPAAWQGRRGVTMVALNATDERTYLVDDNGRNLLPFLHADVEVTGSVYERDGTVYITVARVRVVEPT